MDENGKLNDMALDMLTMFIGIMTGVAIANETIKKMADEISKKVAK